MTDTTTISAHTPGPWRYNQVQEFTINSITGERSKMRDLGFSITAIDPAMFGGTRVVEQGIYREENARLICAAPDMLTAIQTALAVMTDPNYDEIHDEPKIENAICLMEKAYKLATGAK